MEMSKDALHSDLLVDPSFFSVAWLCLSLCVSSSRNARDLRANVWPKRMLVCPHMMTLVTVNLST